MSFFQSFVYSHDFEIFCVCETWLSDNIHDHEILPDNFILYRKDRPSRGGGVLIAVTSSYHSVTLPSPSDLHLSFSLKLFCEFSYENSGKINAMR